MAKVLLHFTFPWGYPRFRARSKKCHWIQGCDHHQRRRLVDRLGPGVTSITIEIDGVFFHRYSVTPLWCGTNLDHEVLAVGYCSVATAFHLCCNKPSSVTLYPCSTRASGHSPRASTRCVCRTSSSGEIHLFSASGEQRYNSVCRGIQWWNTSLLRQCDLCSANTYSACISFSGRVYFSSTCCGMDLSNASGSLRCASFCCGKRFSSSCNLCRTSSCRELHQLRRGSDELRCASTYSACRTSFSVRYISPAPAVSCAEPRPTVQCAPAPVVV